MRLIDADELAEELSKRVWYKREDEKQAVRIVKEFPTVDAVSVCRCKDCKWFCTDDNNGSCGWRSIPGGVSGEWFCADGERKGGNE